MNIGWHFHNSINIFNGINLIQIALQIADAFFIQAHAIHSCCKEIPYLLFVASLFSIGFCCRCFANFPDLRIDRILYQLKDSIALLTGRNRILLEPFTVGIHKKITARIDGWINVRNKCIRAICFFIMSTWCHHCNKTDYCQIKNLLFHDKRFNKTIWGLIIGKIKGNFLLQNYFLMIFTITPIKFQK